ncbi:MAG: hypothetical protein M1837_003208 [Sclerophora amabilis]|nr:MAG: hypothetical protein M1837_003208 [Sclerophora amabilis]
MVDADLHRRSVQFAAPLCLVQRIRETLDKRHALDTNRKIKHGDDRGARVALIPSTIPIHEYDDEQLILEHARETLCLEAGISGSQYDLVNASPFRANSSESTKGVNYHFGVLLRAFEEWFGPRLFDTSEDARTMIISLIEKLSKSYVVYPPMALFSGGSFPADMWARIFQDVDERRQKDLYGIIAKTIGVTHIAVNAPIPAFNSDEKAANYLRRPANIQPLHGDFGDLITSNPTTIDFESALWVNAKHDRIHETWAPLYTMFSRGNIKEKARILGMVRDKFGGVVPEESAAVDLYAGIGYFAFGYAKAGMAKVFCWELNPWSVEGFRRGAAANRLTTSITRGSATDCADPSVTIEGDEQLLMFEEDNALAAQRIQKARGKIPPVRHVNCGLLPTSEPSWEQAVRVVDPDLGGWIHAHLNTAEDEIAEKQVYVLGKFRSLAIEILGHDYKAQCDHVQRVKTFAPGVMHCVMDVRIFRSDPFEVAT